MRVQFNGRIPAFQAGRVGSIPITRSICVCSSAGQSNCLLSNGPGVRVPSDTPENNRNCIKCSFLLLKNKWWIQFSWLERQFVALNVVGSNPTIHPILFFVQGCKTRGYSQVGKAPDFDSGMRRFESCYPCHLYGPLAQLAEHLTFNQVVRGSNLRWLTTKRA